MAGSTIAGSSIPRSTLEGAVRSFRPTAQPYFEHETTSAHRCLTDNFERTPGVTLGEMKKNADGARVAAKSAAALNTLRVGLCLGGAAVCGLVLHNTFAYFMDPAPFIAAMGETQAFHGACAGTFGALAGLLVTAKLGVEAFKSGRAAAAEERTQARVGQALSGWGQYFSETSQGGSAA